MKSFPPHIVKALEKAFADLKKNHGWDEEEALNQIIHDWLMANDYLPQDESTEIQIPKTDRKICPECGHVFQGNGWDGIDAHWRSKHERIMPYEMAWPLLRDERYIKPSSS